MKMTLLELTQNILSAMDSDEVNSIDDTVESQQVAEILKETFYDLFANIDLPDRTGIIKLEGLGDLAKANYLRIPSNVISLSWVKYYDGKTSQYKNLYYMEPEKFLQRVFNNKSTMENVALVTDDTGVIFYIKNDQTPTYYTILNDKYLVTDSYDAAYDSTLQASKTFAWGESQETWQHDDNFVPSIDATLFPLFLSEAKSVAFITLKQTANQKEEQRSRRHRVHLQYRKFKDKRERQEYFDGVNYARNR